MALNLASFSRTGLFYDALPGQKVVCYACGHRCLIKEGQQGICRVRFNKTGRLHVPFGYVGALAVDPIEKKPFFHALPDSQALSFGMLGCDLHCAYCQNWNISQVLRDPMAQGQPQSMSPKALVTFAKEHGAKSLVSTYNEPLITSEWAMAVFQEAKQLNLKTGYVSNGNATPDILKAIRPWVDLYKVDLKSFSDRQYRRLGGNLRKITDSIKMIYKLGFWLEIVTLLIPGFNNSDEEIKDMARFIKNISPNIPWHVTAYHRDYHMKEPQNTSAEQLCRAATLGKEAGLHFCYAGNLPGQVDSLENTHCPKCQTTLIERDGFQIQKNLLTKTGGLCPLCQTPIPGIWK